MAGLTLSNSSIDGGDANGRENEDEGVEGPPSPLHLPPTSPNPSEPDQTPRARHPGHVKSASISAGSGGSSAAAREAPASAGAAEGRGDSSRWRRLLALRCKRLQLYLEDAVAFNLSVPPAWLLFPKAYSLSLNVFSFWFRFSWNSTRTSLVVDLLLYFVVVSPLFVYSFIFLLIPIIF